MWVERLMELQPGALIPSSYCGTWDREPVICQVSG